MNCGKRLHCEKLGKCDGEKGALQEKVHCGKGRIVEKAALWKRCIMEKAALWKSEKYAKKIWHAGVNKPTPTSL